jgi:hypothetical protein
LEIKRSVLVPYATRRDVRPDRAGRALPAVPALVHHANILERSDEWVAARIDFKYLQVRFGFQTRNPKRARSG